MGKLKNIVFGAKAPKKDIREFRVKTTKKAFALNIPDEFELSMPAVKNQGSVGSCVAHSISTAVEYFNKLQEGTDVAFSVGYIYGNRQKLFCKEGISIVSADVTKKIVKMFIFK